MLLLNNWSYWLGCSLLSNRRHLLILVLLGFCKGLLLLLLLLLLWFGLLLLLHSKMAHFVSNMLGLRTFLYDFWFLFLFFTSISCFSEEFFIFSFIFVLIDSLFIRDLVLYINSMLTSSHLFRFLFNRLFSSRFLGFFLLFSFPNSSLSYLGNCFEFV